MNWTPSTTTQTPPPPPPVSLVTTGGNDQAQVPKENASLASFYSSIASSSSGAGGFGVEVDDDSVGGVKVCTPRTLSPAVITAAGGELDDDEESHQDLLVFGYGCKIFRDEERARWIEDEKHLIPWMGDKNLLIDRYDGRGALMDISRYEPGFSEQQDDSFQGLVSSYQNEDRDDDYLQDEKQLEKELEEERYRDLNEEEDYDERAYERGDADYKRLQSAVNGMLSETENQTKRTDNRHYAAFQYNYDEKNQDICIGPEPKRLHDEDAPYVKPVGLYIPEEIVLPKTVKNHAIIEKTAKFIASQGSQMEIILKTKQARNPLFDFLNHSGKLNPYYKFIVHAVRTGIYRPPAEDVQDMTSAPSMHDLSGSEEDADHTYLHPSLFRTSMTSSVDAVPLYSASFTGSATAAPPRHNAYSMLVSKIKGTDSPDPLQTNYNSVSSQQQNPSVIPTDQQGQDSDMYSACSYKLPSNTEQSSQAQLQRPQKQLPSSQDQLIIEKMASYVIKNGANFEALVKNKADTRFGFLNPSHEYHWYYLNCKERFKAETVAVVASREFVTYGKNLPGQPSIPSTASPGTSSVKKSAAAELAELKRKSTSVLSPSKKDKAGGVTSSANVNIASSVILPAESVFSQSNLVKEKDKPVIRFSSALGLNTLSSSGSTTDSDRDKGKQLVTLVAPQGSTSSTPSPPPSPRSQETIDSDNDDPGGLSPFDDAEGNTTPASDDEEQVKRQMERKRKAALFLQKLKMKNTLESACSSVLPSEPGEISVPKKATPEHSAYQAKESGSTAVTGTSLGDLLSRRLQTESQERLSVKEVVSKEAACNYKDSNGTKSSSSNRHSSRSRSYAQSSRRSRRSYSSSSGSMSSSYEGGTHYSKKKSSKRKHKKKKKKHEKSSRSSSRKSKRRK